MAASTSSDIGAVLYLVEMFDHPTAHRVVAAGEVVRVVGVEALDPDSGPSDPAARTGTPMVLREFRIALGGVAIVDHLQGAGVDLGLGPTNAAGAFEPTDEKAIARPDQPVPGGHGRAVVEYRRIANHARRTGRVANHNLESTLGRASEKLGDCRSIGLSRGCHRRYGAAAR
jgi:hypothetical protein